MGITVDSNYIYAACWGENAIKIYGIGGSGAVSPIRTIVNAPVHGIAVNANNIFAADYNSGMVRVYNLSASGNAPPLRTITGLAYPVQMSIDAYYMYIADPGAARVSVYNLTDNGSVPPVRTITGPSSMIGVAVDPTATPPVNGGTPVPVMNGWWLLPGMLAGLGIFARRRKE